MASADAGDKPKKIIDGALVAIAEKSSLYPPARPDMDTDGSIEEMVRRFNALKTSKFALDMTFAGMSGVAAKIMGEPTDLTVEPSSDKPENGLPIPIVTWNLPIMRMRMGSRVQETVRMNLDGLKYGVIGRKAIADMLRAVAFDVDIDSMDGEEITNLPYLRSLSLGVNQLHELGMKEVDTSVLNRAVLSGNRYYSRKRDERFRTPVNRRRSTASVFGG